MMRAGKAIVTMIYQMQEHMPTIYPPSQVRYRHSVYLICCKLISQLIVQSLLEYD